MLYDFIKKNYLNVIGFILIFLVFLVKDIYKTPFSADHIVIDVSIFIFLSLLFLFNIWIFNQSRNEQIDSTLDSYSAILNILKEEFESNNAKYETHLKEHSNWIYSSDRLAKEEKKLCTSKLKEIWIASSNLKFETEDSPFLDAIKNNITDGISYHYIIPTSMKNEASTDLDYLIEYAKDKKGSIKFTYIDDSNKDLFLFLSNIVIYRTTRPTVYKELVQKENDNFTNPWQKIDSNRRDFQELFAKFQNEVLKN